MMMVTGVVTVEMLEIQDIFWKYSWQGYRWIGCRMWEKEDVKGVPLKFHDHAIGWMVMSFTENGKQWKRETFWKSAGEIQFGFSHVKFRFLLDI